MKRRVIDEIDRAGRIAKLADRAFWALYAVLIGLMVW